MSSEQIKFSISYEGPSSVALEALNVFKNSMNPIVSSPLNSIIPSPITPAPVESTSSLGSIIDNASGLVKLYEVGSGIYNMFKGEKSKDTGLSDTAKGILSWFPQHVAKVLEPKTVPMIEPIIVHSDIMTDELFTSLPNNIKSAITVLDTPCKPEDWVEEYDSFSKSLFDAIVSSTSARADDFVVALDSLVNTHYPLTVEHPNKETMHEFAAKVKSNVQTMKDKGIDLKKITTYVTRQLTAFNKQYAEDKVASNNSREIKPVVMVPDPIPSDDTGIVGIIPALNSIFNIFMPTFNLEEEVAKDEFVDGIIASAVSSLPGGNAYIVSIMIESADKYYPIGHPEREKMNKIAADTKSVVETMKVNGSTEAEVRDYIKKQFSMYMKEFDRSNPIDLLGRLIDKTKEYCQCDNAPKFPIEVVAPSPAPVVKLVSPIPSIPSPPPVPTTTPATETFDNGIDYSGVIPFAKGFINLFTTVANPTDDPEENAIRMLLAMVEMSSDRPGHIVDLLTTSCDTYYPLDEDHPAKDRMRKIVSDLQNSITTMRADGIDEDKIFNYAGEQIRVYAKEHLANKPNNKFLQKHWTIAGDSEFLKKLATNTKTTKTTDTVPSPSAQQETTKVPQESKPGILGGFINSFMKKVHDPENPGKTLGNMTEKVFSVVGSASEGVKKCGDGPILPEDGRISKLYKAMNDFNSESVAESIQRVTTACNRDYPPDNCNAEKMHKIVDVLNTTVQAMKDRGEKESAISKYAYEQIKIYNAEDALNQPQDELVGEFTDLELGIPPVSDASNRFSTTVNTLLDEFSKEATDTNGKITGSGLVNAFTNSLFPAGTVVDKQQYPIMGIINDLSKVINGESSESEESEEDDMIEEDAAWVDEAI